MAQSAQTALSASRNANGQFVPGGPPGPGYTREMRAERNAQQELASTFVEDLRDDWQLHGKSVLREVRESKPDQYLRVITAVLPKTIELQGNVELSVVGLLEEVQRRVIDGVAEVIDDPLDDVPETPPIAPGDGVTDLPPIGDTDELDELLEGL